MQDGKLQGTQNGKDEGFSKRRQSKDGKPFVPAKPFSNPLQEAASNPLQEAAMRIEQLPKDRFSPAEIAVYYTFGFYNKAGYQHGECHYNYLRLAQERKNPLFRFVVKWFQIVATNQEYYLEEEYVERFGGSVGSMQILAEYVNQAVFEADIRTLYKDPRGNGNLVKFEIKYPSNPVLIEAMKKDWHDLTGGREKERMRIF